MNTGNKPKTKNQPESQQEATTQPDQDKGKVLKSANINLLAFKRIKANGEQPATTYYLKACTNCNKKFATENRENETCSDDCQSDNRIRGGGRFVFESILANIPNDFDLEEFPKRNETQTIAEQRREEEAKALEALRVKREAEKAKSAKKYQAQQKQKQKEHENKIKAYLASLPEDLESAVKSINANNRALDFCFHITIDSCIDEMLICVAEIAGEENGNFVVFPFDKHLEVFIQNIKNGIDLNKEQTTREILENFEMSFILEDENGDFEDFELTVNGLLQAKLFWGNFGELPVTAIYDKLQKECFVLSD